MSMKKSLLMDLKVGQSVSIDDGRIVITLEEKSGQRAKLRFVHDGATIERMNGGQAGEGANRLRSTSRAKLALMGTKIAAQN